MWKEFVALITNRCLPDKHHWHNDSNESGVRYCCKCDLMQFKSKVRGSACDENKWYWSDEGNYRDRFAL